MYARAAGYWLAVGLLFGCVAGPEEVVGVYQGQDGSSGTMASDGPSNAGGSGGTGPVADGSASSGTSMPPDTLGDGTTTAPVDPSTTDPDTGTSGAPLESTGSVSTSDEPGSTSIEPPPPPPLTCDELFDRVSGYVLCMHDADSCTFNVNPNGNTCTTICSDYGQSCLGGLDNPGDPGTECMVQGLLDCEAGSGKSNTICICSR